MRRSRTPAHCQRAFPDPNAPGTNARIYVERSDLDYGIESTAIRLHREQSTTTTHSTNYAKRRRAWGVAASPTCEPSLSGSRSTRTRRFSSVSTAILLARATRLALHVRRKIRGGQRVARTGALALSGGRRSRPDLRGDVPRSSRSRRAAARRNRELYRLLGPVELHLSRWISRQFIASKSALARRSSTSPATWNGRLATCALRWLLNIAYMTLGEYPEHVPRAFLIPRDAFASKLDVGQFENVRSAVGLVCQGPEHGRRQYLR